MNISFNNYPYLSQIRKLTDDKMKVYYLHRDNKNELDSIILDNDSDEYKCFIHEIEFDQKIKDAYMSGKIIYACCEEDVYELSLDEDLEDKVMDEIYNLSDFVYIEFGHQNFYFISDDKAKKVNNLFKEYLS